MQNHQRARHRGRRSFWTWGYVRDEPSHRQRLAAARVLSKRFGRRVRVPKVPRIGEVKLRRSRVRIPAELRSFVTTAKSERITHTYGGHSLELLKALRGKFEHPPDAVAHPADEAQLEAVLAWCDSHGYCVVPYGGGTSVVEGVQIPADAPCAVTIDMDRFNQVLEIDPVSRAVRVQAGILGPELEADLRPHGLTLRHFPQSFAWSTVGGWVVTRSGGHYATNHTHIDDFVESTRMLTPAGWFESRRLPGSGAGPSPDRLVIGSEGTLGILSECWLRLQRRPRFRASAGVYFRNWRKGTEAVRAIVQTKLFPANLRILDAAEARLSAGVTNGCGLLIIGFESGELSQAHHIREAVAVAREFGGRIDDEAILIDDGLGKATGRSGAVGAWRQAFIGVNAGTNLGLGLLADTFETAVTWDRWPAFDRSVRRRVGKVLKDVLGPDSVLSCRFTHVYPDGPAPYYSFQGPVRLHNESAAWAEIKSVANDAVVHAGGTITHHHAVGRMHKLAWQKQRPELFESMLRAAKAAVDPNGLLNPGVLIDPEWRNAR